MHLAIKHRRGLPGISLVVTATSVLMACGESPADTQMSGDPNASQSGSAATGGADSIAFGGQGGTSVGGDPSMAGTGGEAVVVVPLAPGILTGALVNPDGTPLPGCDVSLRNSGTVVAAAQGSFTLAVREEAIAPDRTTDVLDVYCQSYQAEHIELDAYDDIGAIQLRRSPNILLAIADDASYPHMSAYGTTFVNTPSFDRIAAQGILFHNTFDANPKCSPARAALLTGRNTWQLEEAADHFGLFPAKFPIYTAILEDAGYAVGFTGKGWGPGRWEGDRWGGNPAGPAFHGRTNSPPTNAISNKNYAENFRDFLATVDDGQPFTFWYGGHEPHRSYQYGTGVAAGKQLSSVEVPEYFPDRENVRTDMLDYALEIEWFDTHLGRIVQILEHAGQLDNTVIIATADNGMPFPRVKGQLYEAGHHVPLAIRWGDSVMPGRVVDDFVSFIDFAPTFLELAGIRPLEGMTGQTLISLLRSPMSGQVEPQRDLVVTGKERHDDLRTDPDTGKMDVGYPIRAIRTHEYLYLRNFKVNRWPAGDPETGYRNIDASPTKSLLVDNQDDPIIGPFYQLAMGKRPEEELYRIDEDPDCMNNLADDPAHAAARQELWTTLESILTEQQDPRILGKGDIFDDYPHFIPPP